MYNLLVCYRQNLMSPFDAVKGNEDEDMRWSVGTWEYDSESTSESEVASESDKESKSRMLDIHRNRSSKRHTRVTS